LQGSLPKGDLFKQKKKQRIDKKKGENTKGWGKRVVEKKGVSWPRAKLRTKFASRERPGKVCREKVSFKKKGRAPYEKGEVKEPCV